MTHSCPVVKYMIASSISFSMNRYHIIGNQKGVNGSEIPQTPLLTKFSRIPNVTISMRSSELAWGESAPTPLPSHPVFKF